MLVLQDADVGCLSAIESEHKATGTELVEGAVLAEEVGDALG